MTKEVNINSLIFKCLSPSEYILKDAEEVAVRYVPRKTRQRALVAQHVTVPPKKKLHGGKRIKVKASPPKYTLIVAVVPEWHLCFPDGEKTKVLKYPTLTAACVYLRELLAIRDDEEAFC